MPPSSAPPFSLSPKHVSAVAEIAERVGHAEALKIGFADPLLKLENTIRSLQASLEIDGITLSIGEVGSAIDRKTIAAAPEKILAVRNAYACYKKLESMDPGSATDLLTAYRTMMDGLAPETGRFRSRNITVNRGEMFPHLVLPADLVEPEIDALLEWLTTTDLPEFLSGAVLHHQLDRIQPFFAGNGRMCRFWQTLILSRHAPNLAYLPFECTIRDRVHDYHAAKEHSDAAPFVEFMLDALLDSLATTTPTEKIRSPVKMLLSRFGHRSDPIPADTLMDALDLRHPTTLQMYYIQPALDGGYIERIRPRSHPHPIEQYRLTEKGKSASLP